MQSVYFLRDEANTAAKARQRHSSNNISVHRIHCGCVLLNKGVLDGWN